MYWLFILSFTMYYFRYTIFYYYCKVYTFLEKRKPVKEKEIKNVIFDTEIYEFFDADRLFAKDKEKYFKLNLIDNSDKTLYQIHPNENTIISDKKIIFCEIIVTDKTYDITSYLKYFYIKDNIILNRHFITYVLYKYFNIKLDHNDVYNISIIDSDMKHITISQDLDSYKYIL
jgi:hypothetical protein